MPTLQEEGPVTVSIKNTPSSGTNEQEALQSSLSTSTTTSVSPSLSIPVSASVSSHSTPCSTTTLAYTSSNYVMPSAKMRNSTGVTVITHTGSQASTNPQVWSDYF